jgi:hypothetical protein
VKRLLALVMVLAGIAWLHLTSTAILVIAGPATDRGEGGSAFDCTYLGTGGFLYVSHFYTTRPASDVTAPPGRSHCSWLCNATLGPRDRGKQLARCN